MTGPEHYREAEKLLGEAADPFSFDLTQAERDTKLLGAQVHATLALAAATAEAFTPVDRSDRSWLGVIR